MTIHKEGYKTIGLSALVWLVLNVFSFYLIGSFYIWLTIVILIITTILFLFIISFFRVPNRVLTITNENIICPADGKVVVMEEIIDNEYFHDKRLQISIFMSPLNVHLNRYPMDGKIVYSQYHHGKYLVAWHPKSSTENERHSIVIEHIKGKILVKQIAGALAKRICNYATEDTYIKQGDELGFIKFGSRVDILLPPQAKPLVSINDHVICGVTPLAII